MVSAVDVLARAIPDMELGELPGAQVAAAMIAQYLAANQIDAGAAARPAGHRQDRW
jgi:hypothetical protein